MKVRLTVDLSKYHPSLTIGAVGKAIGPYGKRSRERPSVWVGVEFEHHTLDVLVKQLERVPEEPERKEGPVLPVQSDTPPKQGQVLAFGEVEFKIDSIVERTGPDTWLVSVRAIE